VLADIYTRCVARTTEELREFADEHLRYEIEMTAGLTARMARHRVFFDAGLSPDDGPLALDVLDLAGRNADLEAWATHMSTVFNFLCCKREHGDVVAYDFFDRHHDWTTLLPDRPKSLRRLNERVPVEIDHLSFGRTKVKDKTWLYVQMWSDLAKLVRLFVDSVPEGRVSREFCEAVRAVLPVEPKEMPTLTHAGMPPFASTATSMVTGSDGGTVTLMPRPEAPSTGGAATEDDLRRVKRSDEQ
jgi:hypothetical protein